MKFLDETEFVAKEYGLEHYTQPDGKVKDKSDAWLEKENGKLLSRITCSEKLNEISVPQCTHNYFSRNLSIRTDFDKRHLKNWRNIKQGLLSLIAEFESPETAKELVQEQLKQNN